MAARAETASARKQRRRRARPAKAGGPGYDGGRELAEERVVNPYNAHLPEDDRRRYQTALRNTRHDPIELLYARGAIGLPEREAGRKVRELVEALGLDAVKAIVLDGAGGGGRRFEFPAHRIDAGRRFMGLRQNLGGVMTALLVRVAGYGETVTLVASGADDARGRANGACSQRMHDRVGWLFRMALNQAAIHFGFGVARGSPSGRMQGWLDEGARPEDVDVAAGEAAIRASGERAAKRRERQEKRASSTAAT